MGDAQLLALMLKIDPQTKRIPPGVRAVVEAAIAAERERWEPTLRTLRNAVIDQNRSGASWHPHVFPRMMDGLARASVLLDGPNPDLSQL